ncbi:hypothetical protein [Piscinibacterium candidicorallinum]|uniref:Uncharacterized protein n=1 Tax=Piscinibacterium candidicorallinum TaxID=1793872 RepID=A0ABV7H824_9BURK
MKNIPLSLTLAAAALAGAFSAAPAHAVGRLADVDIIDRDTGRQLPVYQHRGRWYVEGTPGSRYAISLRNQRGERVLAVMSVDGVNVITGDTAAPDQDGYVFSPYQQSQILGWRKSDSRIAQFVFTALPDSYAARTGRPDNVGVIGVALFREQAPRWEPPVNTAPAPWFEGRGGAAKPGAAAESAPASASPSADAARSPEASAMNKGFGAAAPQRQERLGTGHGASEYSYAGRTTFERASRRPAEVITIFYDSRENLLSQGVIPRPWWPNPAAQPNPFPEQARYTPDPPPRWWR